MPKKKPQTPAKTRKTPAKALRDAAIVAGSLGGKPNSAIAAELGIDRETVAKVLSSDDIRLLTGQIDNNLSSGIERAVRNVLRTVKKGDLKTSIALLRNFGSMRNRLELTGKDGAPLAGLSDEQLDARVAMLLEKLGKGTT